MEGSAVGVALLSAVAGSGAQKSPRSAILHPPKPDFWKGFLAFWALDK